MNWADIAILAIVALSAVIGFFRGFLREVIGLATWVLAFCLAFMGAEIISTWFARWINANSIRIAVAFAVIFVAVLILGAIVNFIMGRLVRSTGFAGTDRTIGGAFGIVRGVAILVALALLAGMTALPQDAWWRQSLLMGHVQQGAVYVRGMLPKRFANAIVYPAEHPRQRAVTAAPELPANEENVINSFN